MAVLSPAAFRFESTFAQALPELSLPWNAAAAPSPRLVVLDESLAGDLGLDAQLLAAPEGVEVLVGNRAVTGSNPVAQAYAGHQFGGYSPRLGDGRALLLGEILDPAGRRWDVHLKGSGRTPFSRGGDGYAALGPMLREYVMGVAMHALGVPTTRALAVVATGAEVQREVALPGAVLVRVASSHIRVGTFEYAWATGGADLVRRLADYSIARHHPSAAESDRPYLALLGAAVEAQAELVAAWMQIGFIHGVMNTDNMTISGESIDYGPCAFMDRYDLGTVYSSIDSGGRYAYGNQPTVARWNLARFAEALLGVIDDDPDIAVAEATEVLEGFSPAYRASWTRGMCARIGLDPSTGVVSSEDADLVDELVQVMQAGRVDMISFMRSLSQFVSGDGPASAELCADPAPDRVQFEQWVQKWRSRLASVGADPIETARRMDALNPMYVPRNHLVEEALAAAVDGDMTPFDRLLSVLSAPFEEQPDAARYALGAPDDFGPYRTFCGT